MDYTISSLEVLDVDAIHALGICEEDYSADGGDNCFWPKDTLVRLVESTSDVTLKLVVNNEIVGFSLAMIHPATKKATLENFFVSKAYSYLAKEFYLEVEHAIKGAGALFIAYFFDTVHDCVGQELFSEMGYFEGNAHLWLHKSLGFSSPGTK